MSDSLEARFHQELARVDGMTKLQKDMTMVAFRRAVADDTQNQANVYIVVDGEGNPIYCAGYPEACHEHINDAINEYDVPGAGKWSVLPGQFLPKGGLGMKNQIDAAVLAERESCAKRREAFADRPHHTVNPVADLTCAHAIRARTGSMQTKGK